MINRKHIFQGDYGAPLLCGSDPDTRYLSGILTFGIGNGYVATPSVFTLVSKVCDIKFN